VSRYKTTVMVLVAAMMMLAAGTPASAKTAAGQARTDASTEVVRKQTVLPKWLHWITMKLKSRYAMAAN
jgi:hypothetical protein